MAPGYRDADKDKLGAGVGVGSEHLWSVVDGEEGGRRHAPPQPSLAYFWEGEITCHSNGEDKGDILHYR